MSRLAEALAAAAQDLDELGAAWALVGGLAVPHGAIPDSRATERGFNRHRDLLRSLDELLLSKSSHTDRI